MQCNAVLYNTSLKILSVDDSSLEGPFTFFQAGANKDERDVPEMQNSTMFWDSKLFRMETAKIAQATMGKLRQCFEIQII